MQQSLGKHDALEVVLQSYEDISYPLKKTRIVLTGAPATGKTTLSLGLEAQGHHVFHEQARQIIQESLEKGSDILPWKDLNRFTEVVWELRNKQYDLASLETLNFYDRSIMDSYAYLLKGNAETKAQWMSDMKTKKFDKIFILPVWPDIHSLDKERMESLEDCIEVESFLYKAYQEMGYELIQVPVGTVEERLAFIHNSI